MNPQERTFLRDIERMPNGEGRFGYMRLDKNEHLDMVSGKVLREYKKQLSREIVSIYPEIEAIREKVAGYVGVPSQQVILSHGSDASIKQVFDVFARENSEVVLLKPTYAMYQIYAKMFGAKVRWIECDNNFVVDKQMFFDSIDKNVSIVAIANPNSPTGSEFDTDFILKCLKKCQDLGVLMLVDEAYFPFSKETIISYVSDQDNLIVTRTFSKAFGLGGCRAGFMAVSKNIEKSIKKARPMYEINALSSLFIKICIENMPDVGRYIKRLEKGKTYLVKECRKLGLNPFPINTNFINIRLPDNIDPGKLEDYGKEHKILFKGRLGAGAFTNCIRVTLGPKEKMVEFIKLIKEFVENE